MLVASKLIPGGAGLAPVLVRRAARVELDWDTRQKSRFDAVDSEGRTIGVFLPRGATARGGDVLVAEDGSLIVVAARPQALLVVSAGPHGSPLDLLRAAYHLGNRHVPLEVAPTHLQLEPDHVLAELLRRMGLQVEERVAAFEPEAGAYDGLRGAGHDHRGHDAHDHAHGQAQGRHDATRRPHVHDASCGHDQGHAHDPAHEQAHGHHDPAHQHGHAHDHDHAHEHGHAHGHGHGPAHGHDHGHGGPVSAPSGRR